MSTFNELDLDSSVALMTHHITSLQVAIAEKNLEQANRIYRRMESECANGVHVTRQMAEHEKQQHFLQQQQE